MAWLIWIGFGALLAGVGVAAGAFGAHGLKNVLSEKQLAVFETAVRYQMYHALALILLGLVVAKIDTTVLRLAGGFFVLGVALFSGSLYALVLTGNKSLGIITPFGGLALIIAWLLMAIGVFMASAT